ncbi:MAG: sulfatase-like hydrolase/transferase [Acidobacteriia bacterium]|nr:sulfatase-like hydrolase/transferase [Terriglobia bacterium]
MGVIRQWLCLVWLAANALAATAPPNIVLITLDTTRADRMGFLGSKRGLTPNLDALARQSAVFTHAYAQAPLTPTSHATILTGTYPQFHQVNDFRVPLAKDLPYAPDILRSHGYHTAAFVGSIVLDPSPTYAPGFDRGFDTYDADFHYEGPGEKHYRTVERRGGEVVAHALAWLNKRAHAPFFIWVHLYDPHDPYDPPEPYKSRYAKEPYDGEIAYVDSVVGKLFRELKVRGLFDGAAVAIMADHGESLGAHGEDTHGVFLYDETIRVPLVIKLPHGGAVGKRFENRVELVDVLPTLLQAVGVEVPAEVQGESLLGMMKAGNGEASEISRDRPAYAESDYPHTAFGWSAERSLRTGKYLYIQAPRQELYDQRADPNALHDLSGTSTAVSGTLAGEVNAFRAKTSSSREAPKAAVDPTAQEKLAALGYVSGGPAQKGAPSEGADPKDKVEISNIVHRANAFRETGRFKEAADSLQQVIAKEPGLTGMYAKLGDNLLDLKEYGQAVPVLRKAAELDPDSPMSHFRLAKALMGTGDFAAAVPGLEFAVAKVPNFADAHVFLEMAYARTNRVPETIRECRTVLEFLPDHFGSYLILGRFLEMSGDLEGAVPNLKKAVTLQPKAPEPHLILADVYDHLGRKADAARELAEARRLGAGGQ